MEELKALKKYGMQDLSLDSTYFPINYRFNAVDNIQHRINH